MENLIRIDKAEDGRNVVSARELHGFLGVQTRFNDWIANRISEYGFVENRDYESFTKISVKPQSGRPSRDYAITLDMAKELSMVEKNEKGKQARRYFIECERRLREHTVRDPQIAALVFALQEIDAVKQEQELARAERERQAVEISRIREDLSVVEACVQPESRYFTVLGWARLKGHRLQLDRAKMLGRLCVARSGEQGIPMGDVNDPRFGKVHSYHETVLEKVFTENGYK